MTTSEHTGAMPDEIEDAAGAASIARPRLRGAAIIWGLVFASLAVWALWILGDAARTATAREWLETVSPAALGAYGVLAIGALVGILGLIGLLRRAQRESGSVAS